jgi:hypothetical protein
MTQLVHSCTHAGSSSFACYKGLTSRECPSQFTKRVNNFKECRSCALSKQIRRVEEVVDTQDMDELSRMFGRKILRK